MTSGIETFGSVFSTTSTDTHMLCLTSLILVYHRVFYLNLMVVFMMLKISVASGIKRVVYIEPDEKILATQLLKTIKQPAHRQNQMPSKIGNYTLLANP